MLELKTSVDGSSGKMKEVAIAFVLFIIVLPPFLIGLDQEIYHGDESLHISRGIKAISLIVHGVIGGEEWDYYYTNEGKKVGGAAITPANVIMGFGPWLIGVKSGGWSFNVKPPDHVLVSARAMVAILGAMTCVILFYLGRALGSFRTGLFASLFLAFNPLWLMSSRRAMRDTPAAFFSTISVLLFYYGLKKETFKAKAAFLALSGVTTGFAFGSKPPAGVILITIAIYLFLMVIKEVVNEYHISRSIRLSQTGRYALLGLIIFVTVSFLAFVASLPYLWTDPYQKISKFFSGGLGFGEELRTGIVDSPRIPGDMLAAATGIIHYLLWPIYNPTLLSHFPTVLTWFNIWWSEPCFSTLPATVLFFAGLAYLALKGAKKGLRKIERLVLLWFVIALTGLSLWVPIFRPRYFIPLIPPIALIEAMGLSYFLKVMIQKKSFLFAGAVITTHIGSTLFGFPKYALFSLQKLFADKISLTLSTIFILSLLYVIIPRIQVTLRRGTSMQNKNL